MGGRHKAEGPDFASGLAVGMVPERGALVGRVGDQAVFLLRQDGEIVALSATCTHYGAPLAPGLSDADDATVRCPWHHACFSLRTGAPLAAPALDPLDRWKVEIDGGTIIVRERLKALPARPHTSAAEVQRIVIIGGGAAGLACANELRRLGFPGHIVMLSADPDPPCDRPNLSKDFLAGTAPEEWLPLRSDDWYCDNRIELRRGVEVQRIDVARRRVSTVDGEQHGFDRLLIATGSEPNRLSIRGLTKDNAITLRSLADARALVAKAERGARVAVIGSSFIGMEAAAALRQRQVSVDIVSLEKVPFEGVFGLDIGGRLRQLHEANGVRFHGGATAAAFSDGVLTLADGSTIAADFVLVGVGVRPRTAIAEAADLGDSGGVPVDGFLETCQPGIFAAGDIAAFPDPLSGETVRIEHWVTAQRQGQLAAANMLGAKRRFTAVPFFWTEQYGVQLRYVGHAGNWDDVRIEGSLADHDFIARYYENGVHRASLGVGRDVQILKEERRFEEKISASSPAGTGQPVRHQIHCN